MEGGAVVFVYPSEDQRRVGIPECSDPFLQVPAQDLFVDGLVAPFVSQLEGQEGASLAQAIVRIGESLSLTAVGEGIETQGQADALMELGCQYGQGFLYAKPMPPAELAEYLEKWHSGPHLEVVV